LVCFVDVVALGKFQVVKVTVERLMFSGQAAPIGILLLAWQMED
jgi:hypothetical protein